MNLRQTYTLWAPLYDRMLRRATRQARIENLDALGGLNGQDIAFMGIGSGLDLELLSADAPPRFCVGLDWTRAMLSRARPRALAQSFPIALIEGDAMRTPLANNAFDTVILHLILAVVPNPAAALSEASRIVRPGGRILIFDKFLRPGQKAWLRRGISPLMGQLATRTDVEFEPLLAAHPELILTRDTPLLARGWFRGITLIKNKD
ncbi:class I SAM-dependent methyltransferase [Halothiobacillus sp.]|uniref:class I SAM-dependent methyltransferase n=1 Tax=Halothiobacillus sp. TaxID=1891311 RepID=UPI002AD47312|nr:methyltransferase domain-containing protein [Halothiobacillus sp.]